MKKYISLLTAAVLLVALLTGCMGTPVVVQDCTCPSEGNPTPTGPSVPVAEGAVKTGLALITSASGSASADGETDGEVSFDNTLVAVTVDDAGVAALTGGIEAPVVELFHHVTLGELAVQTTDGVGTGIGGVLVGHSCEGGIGSLAGLPLSQQSLGLSPASLTCLRPSSS